VTQSPLGPRLGQIATACGAAPVVLRWWEWGPEGGRPVVCVHGLTRNARDFDALAAALAEQGRRVLCVDVPGRGVSGWLPAAELYAVPLYAQALLPLLAALGEHDWVGTSMGGLIGMALAAAPGASGIRRLVLNDIGPFVPAAAIARIRAYMAAAPEEFADLPALERHLREVHSPFGPLSDAQWRHLAEHSACATAAPGGRVRLHYDPLIKQSLGTGDAEDISFWDLWEAGGGKLPGLVLRGETSDILPAEVAGRLAAGGARVEIIAGCGHAPALMESGQIGLVRGFLAAG
jgi:pimeloyl-ACP methyl ester carboxylesterase